MVLLSMLPVLGIGAWLGFKEYNRTNKDLSIAEADVKISAINLISEFEDNDSAANVKYLGKILELDGNVKKVETDEDGNYTIILGESGNLSSVRCSMDTIYSKDAARVKEGSSVIIRGACTGYKKNELLGENLGSDVELNRGIIVKQ